MKQSKKLILSLSLIISILLLTLILAAAEQIGDKNSVYWNDPAVPVGYAECALLDLNDAKLIEEVHIVYEGKIIWATMRDTGRRGFIEPSSGLAIVQPFTISVETDSFPPGTYSLRYCHHWLVHGICQESQTKPVTQTVCFQPVVDGEPIEVDADCCWLSQIFTSTLRLYLPIILKEGPPIRP